MICPLRQYISAYIKVDSHCRSLWVFLTHPLRRVEDVLLQGMCDIVGLPKLTALQREQAVLPHMHGGMGLRRFSEDLATAARLARPHPPLSRPCPPGPPALPSPPHPPSHVLHEAMLLHSSSPHAPDATLIGVTCWNCSLAVLSWRTYV